MHALGWSLLPKGMLMRETVGWNGLPCMAPFMTPLARERLTNAMVDFLDGVLPPECVHIVWTLLPISDLAAVMQASKAWAHSAAPFLYRDVPIDAAWNLEALLRTAERQPGLVASVRSLSLHQYVKDGPDKSQSLDGPAVALLRHLPGLQALFLEGWWADFEALLTSDGQRFSVPFAHLRHLSLGSWARSLAHLAPVWALPHIESLRTSAEATSADDQIQSLSAAWPACPTLTTLILRRASLSDQDVGVLLKHSPALTTFRWDRWIELAGEPTVQDCDELGRALHHVRQTVKEIDLRIRLYYKKHQDVRLKIVKPVRGRLALLSDFTSLQTLRIPAAVLLGWAPHNESPQPEIEDLLPPSLQRLCLYEDPAMYSNLAYTEAVISAKLERLFTSLLHGRHRGRELKHVEITSDVGWGEIMGSGDAAKQKLRDMAAQVGVEFQANQALGLLAV
ncbi:hypothetical protein EKO27_g8558 [Xylaria grammica]|uniref:F-box domain-containing protein n=1 Tax=Xylaria grammica TaxID=363999 RepID=A0A439CWH8_9PEZI|nr:hypothetical protein EKO27_g8558 [Xylaria grammica]